MAIQEGRGQPVVLHTGILVDITDLEGSDELPPVVQDTDLIPLGRTKTKSRECLHNSTIVPSPPESPTGGQEDAAVCPPDGGHRHVFDSHNHHNLIE